MKYVYDKLLMNFFLNFVFVSFIVVSLGYLQLFHVKNFMALSLKFGLAQQVFMSELKFGIFVRLLLQEWQHLIRMWHFEIQNHK